MKFPGSKLLHEWDLSVHSMSMEDLVRSCEQVGLTGLAQLAFPHAAAMVFYYKGVPVNAFYREGPMALTAEAAIERLRTQIRVDEGTVGIYELPLDMAHMLRGATNRRKHSEPIRSPAALEEFLHGLEKAEHTGTLELNTPRGAAIFLLVRGRVSNVYWESEGGSTFEKAAARTEIMTALKTCEATLVVSEFSQEVFKARHQAEAPLESHLSRREPAAPATTSHLVSEEMGLREQLLEQVASELPSLLRASLFDVLTGAELVQRVRSGAPAEPIADKAAQFIIHVRALLGEHPDETESLELLTDRTTTVVVVIPKTWEAVVATADRSLPAAVISGVLTRAAHAYATQFARIGAKATTPA